MRQLLIRPGGIGDCLLCLPAMAEAAGADTEVWCPSAVLPLMELVPFARRADAILRTGLDGVGIPCVAPPASLVERLRGFHRIVSWYGTNREAFQEAVYRLGLPFEFRPALPPMRGDVHAVDFFLGRSSGGTAYPRLRCPAPVGAGYVAIHPFSGDCRKNWPLERFAAVAGEVGMPVEWSAGPEERLAGARRFGSLAEMARWLAGARLYIGNDSGITHLAAAVGTPVIALFGEASSDARVWAPRGEQVRVMAEESMEAIAVDAVVDEARRMLAGR